MPSVDEGESEDANQDLAAPRRRQTNAEAASVRPPHLSPERGTTRVHGRPRL